MTPDDVLAWAEANPDGMVAVIDRLLLARAWEEWWPLFARHDAIEPVLMHGYIKEIAPGRWAWWYNGKPSQQDPSSDALPTSEEARAAVDAGLRARGIALANT